MHTDLSFGQWLKRRRRGAGLTQEELAARVGYAVATLRKIERDELRPARPMAERLAEELGLEPGDRAAFVRFARDEGADTTALPTQTAQLTPQASPPHAPNLPRPLTSLVGREAESAAVQALLARDEVCLVTLVGPGGTGKTRLALEVARALTEDGGRRTEDGLQITHAASRMTEHGVYFVNLVPIRDPALVPSTIAQAVGVKEQGGQPLFDSLKVWLRDKQALLLLDNFEQVIRAAPLVADLLAACPGLKALVTSRETLHISGEHEYFVPPLALPPVTQDEGRKTDDENTQYGTCITDYEAVNLFVQRAQAVRPDFAVTPANARAVAEICRRLDGLPLAIELAAARVKLFPPDALLAHLDSRLALLTGGPRDLPARQQTLRGAIDWSYELLTNAEKALFRRLAVFPGRRSLEAVMAVCAEDGGRGTVKRGSAPSSVLGPSSIIDGLASLIDKSLLRQVGGPEGEPRFAMLETLREYALERLRQSGEEPVLRRALAEYYFRFTTEAQRHFFGPELGVWLDRVEAELNNIRAVLGWSLGMGGETLRSAQNYSRGEAGPSEPEAQRLATGLEIAGLLWRFWALRGRITEGRAWLDALLAKGDGLPPSARHYALHTTGNLASDQGDYRRARELYAECLTLSQGLGKALMVAHMHNNLGNIALLQGDYAHAEGLFQQALAGYRGLGQTWGAGMVLSNLGELARLRGDVQRARSCLEESLRLVGETRDEQRIAETLYILGRLALDQADLAEAMRHLDEALHLYQAGANKLGEAVTLDALGETARCQGDSARAVDLHRRALALLRDLGDRRSLALSLYGLGRVAQAQGDLGEALAAHRESLSLLRALGDKGGLAQGLESVALLAAASEQPQRAARLLGAVAALRDALGLPRPPVYRAEYGTTLTALRVALGEAAFTAAWDDGRALTPEQAVDYALGPGTPPDTL